MCSKQVDKAAKKTFVAQARFGNAVPQEIKVLLFVN